MAKKNENFHQPNSLKHHTSLKNASKRPKKKNKIKIHTKK